MARSRTDVNLELVDAHCHIDLFPRPLELIEDAERRRIHTIAVTNAPSVFYHTRNLCCGRDLVHAAVGLHPELVHSHGRELQQMWAHLEETRFVGEVGLDYVTSDQELRRNQRGVFSAILSRCAERRDSVITVHSRRSAGDVISAVGEKFPGTVILHWFSGTREELDRAAAIGCWFSVNPSMVASRNGQILTAKMPRDRVLTETDGPFIKVHGEAARPPDVIDAVKGLASIWELSIEDAAAIVLQNFRRAIGARNDDGVHTPRCDARP